MEAVLWIVRTGSPWRDLPATFGHWNSVFRRFRRWAVAGVFERVFKALQDDPDFEYVMADGTIVRVHQKAAGAKGEPKLRPLGARAAV
jgi:transposase